MPDPEFAPAPGACLTHRVLSDLSRGTLSTGQVRAIVAHLPSCPRCADSLRTFCETQISSCSGDESDATLGFGAADAQDETAPSAGVDAIPPILKTYAVLGKIGQGGMGVVYEAWNIERGARVALKTLPRVDPTSLYRFKREFRARADLVHPNLITLHELISDRGLWFFTMDRLEGVDFLAYVRGGGPGFDDLPSTEADPDLATLPDAGGTATEFDAGLEASGGAIDAPVFVPDRAAEAGAWRLGRCDGTRLCRALRQLAEGLMAVHEAGLLHRDLKPSNVMVERGGRLVILDFGLVAELVDAGPADDEDGNGTGSGAHPVHYPTSRRLAGTVDYMAPEQAAGLPLTSACDWYGVGVMFYEALAGRRPFTGPVREVLRRKQDQDPPSPGALAVGVPAAWDEFCLRLLCRSPEGRPTGRDLLQFLDREGPASDRDAPAAGSGAAAEPAPPPFVGRRDALEALRDAAREGWSVGSVLQLVHGRSGAGKSTLLQRFQEELRGGTVVVFRGRCYEHESVPYKALDSLIDDLARHLRRQHESPEAADLSPLARLFPVFRGIGGAAEAGSSAVEPQEQRRLAFVAFRRLVAGLARCGGVVLILDDLQWGDVDSALLLIDLLRAPAIPGLLVVGVYRSEYAGHSEFLKTLLGRMEDGATVRTLAVGPLGPAEARELILRTPGAAGLDEGRIEAVIREARGNPLFLHELVKRLLSDRAFPGPGAGGVVDLEEVIWSRVAELPPEARRLLELVAVAGRPIRQGSAYRAADLMGRERSAASALRAGRFVRSTGQGLEDALESFHDSIRETVVRRLDPEALAARHLQLARTLEADGAADPETLAVHWIGAGETERAGDYYAEAADRAAASLAFQRAADLYRLAATLRPMTEAEARPLRRKLAEALANAGRSHEAAQTYLACARGAAGPEWVDLQRQAGYHFAISGHLREGREVFDAILRRFGLRARRSKSLTLLSILARSALIGLRGLDFRERDPAEIPPAALERLDVVGSASMGLSTVDAFLGIDFHKRCLLMALRLGEPSRVVTFLTVHAAAQSARGEAGRVAAGRCMDRVEALARRAGDPLSLAMVDIGNGFVSYHVARWRATREAMLRAQARLLEHGRVGAWERQICDEYILASTCHMGRFAELAELRARLRDQALERGDLLALSNLDAYLGAVVHVCRDDPATARRELGAVMAHWTEEDHMVTHLKALSAETVLDLYEGRGASSLARLRARWGTLRRSLLLHSQILRIKLHNVRGISAVAAAFESPAPEPYLRAAAADARRLAREPSPLAAANAAAILGAVAAARRDADRALPRLRAAAAGFDALDMPAEAAAARLARGRLAGGDEGAAEARDAEQGLASMGVLKPARFAAMLSGIRA